MPKIDGLIERTESYLDPAKVRLIERAYYVAKEAHEGQFRRSGDPYIIHPIAVANILADLHLDHETLMAALLHDVIEDTPTTKEELAAEFGEAVAELVDGVSKLTQIEFKSKAEAQAHNFQKMTLAMADDIRVILVKLADRLHNMRTLGPLHHEKRRRIATETLDIYAPIANRLGINSIRTELEDLGFQALYPMRSKYIRKAVKKLRGNHNEILDEIQGRIEKQLNKRNLNGTVVGREKHLYSIYQKMKYKHRSFHEIMDVYAFRIISDSEDDCYRILGALHALYKPLPFRFKDYIAVPKVNGYQSLHTTLFGMHVNIEVQIRTVEMENLANNGIAAHWQYKDDSSLQLANQARIDRWLSGLKEIRENAGDSMEFIEHVKIDLFPDEIYVFTPKGAILELPAGATPIDFAYAIHTDVGNACVACRVNKQLASLSEPLQSGQTIEIITAPGAKPSPAWLNIVATGKAKSSIRHFIKQKQHAENLSLGRTLLEKSMAGISLTWENVDEPHLHHVLEHNKVATLDELILLIGQGLRMPYIIARQLATEGKLGQEAEEAPRQKLMIKGTEGMQVSFSSCCHPIPGDPIIGLPDNETGLVIHSEQCKKALRTSKAHQRLYLSWMKDITDEFAVELQIQLERHRGIIAELASAVTHAEANIEHIGVTEQNAHMSVIKAVIHIQGRRHLARVIRRIRNIKAVISIQRIVNH
ncbi:(p)ppGpp synthetase [Oleiphilus sp. HI0071]|uniref:RelA/SpoT family protein n=1 Tax=unclassified Oleiphilus TaxID=2631174 RepID=UPI0007C3D04F|nr:MULTISPECIES: RelA/SpoT family protein [unclassified Oleiphilus]KZY61646.1 (p)ppGpp synthetase [Oleiphilus sp. HI0065]KZY81827.1 (p)ppGpp synthetase [Oleiphilus sp. HI0071]KZY92568.1 (p)ppGpp synthetase [Oleiphilus sp. HI0073]KZZ50523.1 (p)ppGpp synthetase [Oleiphilus sp. HI0118]KZZ52833.1 (p)ppGpp synthetase [Oleiphilus sp. HI0122]KZZ69872.1 (p)ppGpp synthetase [Oleiphilus sp. HI0130]KZZ82468.1 (p)ppGpp synthetase [Oleiphilus sp. HI0133]